VRPSGDGAPDPSSPALLEAAARDERCYIVAKARVLPPKECPRARLDLGVASAQFGCRAAIQARSPARNSSTILRALAIGAGTGFSLVLKQAKGSGCELPASRKFVVLQGFLSMW